MKVKGGGPPPSTDPSEWPHRPAYICAHPDVQTPHHKEGSPLPLDEIVEFETDLFQGKMICRLKPVPPTPDKDEAAIQAQEEYFASRNTHYQFIIQGRFKREIPFSDLVIGDFYERPMLGVPKGLFIRMYQRFLESLYPGMVMDMTSEKPKVFTPLASAQIMRVDLPGNEPNIHDKAVLQEMHSLEDTTLLFEHPIQPPTKLPRPGTTTSPSKRRGHLSKPKNACHYQTNPNHIYTIEWGDAAMCFGSYYQYAVGFKIDLAKSMNAQPLAFAIFTRQQEIVCKFPIWNERLIDEMKAAETITEESPEDDPSDSVVVDRPDSVWQSSD
ncbi:unnamed protein product [Cylindrotheca closterium]|uniref:Domain of unknown function at the cortex 1 domain-containing protein n=1 Tax=Cylindrotheca closterium TaxID=2856 RepID=A0AAD2G2X0_9STRA|nr:unnamed protein product [Cylindrotheca closterium]